MLTPLAAFERAVEQQAERIYLRQQYQSQWVEYSWREVATQAKNIACQITQMGIQPGDRVAIWSEQSADCIIADLAIMMAGAVSVPLYAEQTVESLNMVLNHSQPKLIFVGSQPANSLLSQINETVRENLITIAMRACTQDCRHRLEHLANTPAKQDYESYVQSPNDELTIHFNYRSSQDHHIAIKAIPHTCQSVANAANLLVDKLDLNVNERVFVSSSMASTSHRLWGEMQSLYTWCELSFSSIDFSDIHSEEKQTELANVLFSIRPTLVFGCAAMWTMLQHHTVNKMKGQARLSRWLAFPFLGLYIQRKLHHLLGLNRVNHFICDGNELSEKQLRWFRALSLPVKQSFGPTESFGYATLSSGATTKGGCAGQPLPKVRVSLSEQHEILLKTPSQYLAETSLCDTASGSIRTGQLGRIDAQGNVYVCGNPADAFASFTNHLSTPQLIERELRDHAAIKNAVIIQYNSQLIAVVSVRKPENAAQRQWMTESLYEHLMGCNKMFRKEQKVNRMILTSDILRVENGSLFPSGEINRQALAQGYWPLIKAMPENQIVIWDEALKQTMAKDQAA